MRLPAGALTVTKFARLITADWITTKRGATPTVRSLTAHGGAGVETPGR